MDVYPVKTLERLSPRLRPHTYRADEPVWLKQSDDLFNAAKQRTNVTIDHDALTGLSRLGGFMKTLKRELSRAQRGRSSGGILIFFDLDNYDALFSEFGHSAADHALRALAHEIKVDIRDMDDAARLRPDGFAVLLADTTRTQALDRTQKMAWRLSRLKPTWKDHDLSLQISVGMKAFGARDVAEDLLRDDPTTQMKGYAAE